MNTTSGPGAEPRRRWRPLRLAAGALVLTALFGCGGPLTPKGPDATPQAVVSKYVAVPISSGGDDAEEYSDGRVNRGSTRLELVDAATNQTVGLRFTGVNLPQGIPIAHAYVQFTAASSSSGAVSLLVRGEAADDSGQIYSRSQNISGRAMTSASVPWSPAPWTAGDEGTTQQTADLAPILQEIVDRPGWTPGNALMLIITGSGTRIAWSANGQPTNPPTLHVEYLFEDSPPSVDAFSYSPAPVDKGSPATFTWSVSDPAGQALSCTLDVDGDGVADFSYSNCNAGSGQSYTYDAGGYYDATLTVTDTDNAVATSTVQVVVSETIVIGAAGDIACRTDSWKFNGGLGTPDYCHQAKTAALLTSISPDAVLPLGDTQYENGALDQFYASYDTSWGQFKSITFPAVGNHEYLTSGATGYYTYFGSVAGDPSKGYYSWDLGNWHFVALNTNCSKAGGCRAGSPQEKWLRQDLANHPANCTLAYWHHPRFSSGDIGGRDWSQDLWQALMDYHADVVLTGHDHNYERFAPQDAVGNADPNGLVEFVVGTGGKNWTKLGTTQPNSVVRNAYTYGILKMVLKTNGYSFAFLPDADGTFTDSGSATCH